MYLFYRNNGSVTVFLSLLLLPVLLFSMLSVDFVKIYGARIITKEACDLTLNTAMANYEQALYDVYGLLSTSADTEELSNNLVKYYENTINAMNIDIEEDDSYVKNIINDVKNIINSDSNVKNVRFNNLIRLKCVEFEASGVRGSELYNPEVVERQVVEYMKYRAPVCITKNFLSKIKVFKDLPKHQKVLEVKSDFDSELSDLEKLCKELYKLLLDYKKIEKEVVNYDIDCYIEESLDGVDNYYGIRDLVKLIYSIYLNDEIKYTNNLEEYSTKEYLDMKSFLEQNINRIIKDVENIEHSNLTECDKLIHYFFTINLNLVDLLNIQRYKNSIDFSFKQYKKMLILEHETYEELRRKEAEKNKIEFKPSENYMLINAINEYDKLKILISDNESIINKYLDNLKNKKVLIKDIVKENFEYLNTYIINKYDRVNSTINQLDNIVEKINYIKNNKLDNLMKLSNQWKNSIDDLSSGQIKDNFKSQYYNSSSIIKKENLEQLIKICNNNKNKFCLHARNIENIKLYNYSLCKKILYKSILNKINSLDKTQLKDNFIALNYCNDEVAEVFIYQNSVNNLTNINNIEESKFYIFLSKMFNIDNKKNTNNYTQKAKSQKNIVLNKVNKLFNDCNKEKEHTNNNNQIPIQGDLYNDLATVLIKSVSSSNIDKASNINKDLDIGNNDRTKEFISDFNNESSCKVSIINGLQDYFCTQTENIRDNLYLGEYITNMFSCRTTNIDKSIVEKSLSGNEFNEKNNFLFGAEQEYILWGKKGDSTSNNLLFTTSAIFGLRYMLNTIYAYSDSEIRAWIFSIAVALAGWTGFGIPIVENVLILVLSLGETSIDLYKLLNGEDVVVYKTFNTWHIKPSTFIKDTAIQISKTVVESCIDSLTDKVEGLVESYSDEKMDELCNTVDNYTEQLANEISINITNSIIIPIYNKISQSTNCYISGDLDENKIINNKTNEIYEDIRKNIQDESDGLIKKVKLMTLDYFMKNELDDLITKIDNKFIQFSKGDSTDDIENFVQKIILEKTNILTKKAKEYVFENGYNKIKNKLKSKVCNIKEDFKTNVGDAIDDFYSEIGSSKYNTQLPDNKDGSVCDNYLVTLNYKEYIKLFLLCGFVMGNGNEYLARMMDLVKLNISHQSTDEKNFLLKNQFTILKISCKTAVRTTLINSRYSKNASYNNIFYTRCFDVFGY